MTGIWIDVPTVDATGWRNVTPTESTCPMVTICLHRDAKVPERKLNLPDGTRTHGASKWSTGYLIDCQDQEAADMLIRAFTKIKGVWAHIYAPIKGDV